MDTAKRLCIDTAEEVRGRGPLVQQGRIGYLVRSKHVLCLNCYHKAEHRQEVRANGVTLYRVNIGQYSQYCHHCGLVLVSALTRAWPELFTREHCGFVDCKAYTR